MDVVLPGDAANVSLAARTGAGNVTVATGSGTTGSHIVNANSGAGNVVVRVPSGLAARIHATGRLAKLNIVGQSVPLASSCGCSAQDTDTASKEVGDVCVFDT
ncbi:MAG: hypothetical protein ACJ78Q_00240 [Chloroflexia bacterium]